MATAIKIVMTAPIISIPKNFHMNLIQFDHSIFAIAREPIRQPEVFKKISRHEFDGVVNRHIQLVDESIGGSIITGIDIQHIPP